MAEPGPLISVVVPTRDRARLLERAIASVRAQTFVDWELIAVDDASTDATPARLAALAAEEPRLRVLRQERALGGAAARNRGIAAARGELVAFLDDDDEWLPAKLERQVARLRGADEAGAVLCAYVNVEPDGSRRVEGLLDPERGGRGALLDGNHSMCALLVRRDALEAIGGFDERLPRLQDADLFWRLAGVTRFAYVREPLVLAHTTPGSVTDSDVALLAAARVLVEKLTGAPAAHRAEWYHMLGHALLARGLVAEGRSLLARSLRLRPWPPQRLLMGALAALGRRPYLAAAGLHRAMTERLRSRPRLAEAADRTAASPAPEAP